MCVGAERKLVRIFVDVQPGFEPNTLTWASQGLAAVHMSPPENSRRLWFEVEVPADIEIWPALFNTGVCLGRGIGHRRILLDDAPPSPGAVDPNADARVFGESPREPRQAANETYAEEPRRSRSDRPSRTTI